MQCLLIVAHGSRREASNNELHALVKQLADQAGTEFGYIGGAFLELAEPSIPDGIQQCIDHGATEIIIMPYFLAAGRHVAEDIPAEVQKKRIEYPEIQMTIADYLGSSSSMAKILLELVRRSSAETGS